MIFFSCRHFYITYTPIPLWLDGVSRHALQAAVQVAVMEGDSKSQTQLLARAVKENRIDVIRRLMEMQWEAVAGLGVMQRSLVKFYTHRELHREIAILPSAATVALSHPKYIRRICRHLHLPAFSIGLLDEVWCMCNHVRGSTCVASVR
jgi:hypothetical protein